jgi:hypothetical protein
VSSGEKPPQLCILRNYKRVGGLNTTRPTPEKSVRMSGMPGLGLDNPENHCPRTVQFCREQETDLCILNSRGFHSQLKGSILVIRNSYPGPRFLSKLKGLFPKLSVSLLNIRVPCPAPGCHLKPGFHLQLHGSIPIPNNRGSISNSMNPFQTPGSIPNARHC